MKQQQNIQIKMIFPPSQLNIFKKKEIILNKILVKTKKIKYEITKKLKKKRYVNIKQKLLLTHLMKRFKIKVFFSKFLKSYNYIKNKKIYIYIKHIHIK